MVGTSNFGSWNGHWSWGKFCSPWAHWILPQYVSSGTLAQLWKPWPILVDLAYFPVPYLKLPNAKSHYIPWDVYIYIYIHVCIYIYTHVCIYPYIPMISPWYSHCHAKPMVPMVPSSATDAMSPATSAGGFRGDGEERRQVIQRRAQGVCRSSEWWPWLVTWYSTT